MYNVAVCDDDQTDLNKITDMLHEIFAEKGIACVIQSFNSAKEMLTKMKKIDIGILDIAMPEINGIDLGRKLKEKHPEAKLIYTTSYEEYCMQAINEIHAFSFLCKPVEKETAFNQISDLIADMKFQEDNKKIEFRKIINEDGMEIPFLRLNPRDILYCEYIKSRRRTSIVLGQEQYEYPCVFEELAKEMEKEQFAVNRRGSIVNLRHISKIKGYVIYLDNGTELPISQKRIMDFRERLNDFLQTL